MSYKLEKPCTKKQKNDFIVEHCHNKGLIFQETENAFYALENWEKFINNEIINNKEEYEEKLAKEKLKNKYSLLNEQLKDLDLKRIRAICEPELKDDESGQTWLEYYNTQIQDLRSQIQILEERINENGIIEQNLPALDSRSEQTL